MTSIVINELKGQWSNVLARVMKGERLSLHESTIAIGNVLSGNVSPVQLAAFLAVLRHRGETSEELAGFAQAMLQAAIPLEISESTRLRLVDTCGTGGDRSGSINVSTIAAIVVAAAGVPVCKHGNRSSSSLTGSADVLEALGIAIDLSPEKVVTCIEEVGIGFCLAPSFHPGMRHVGPVRKDLGVATAFNILGPLVNPSRLQRQVIGVSDPSVAALMLDVLKTNGTRNAMVVYGEDGLDELTVTGMSTVHQLKDGETTVYKIDPREYGISYADSSALSGGDPKYNAERALSILTGEQSPQSDIVALNAAAALLVGDAVENMGDGVELAQSLLQDGSAEKTLQNFIQVSRGLCE